MFKVGDKVKHTSNSPVFPKNKVYEVEAANSHFFVVQGLCFNQAGKHWALHEVPKLGDWAVSRSGFGVELVTAFSKAVRELIKVDVSNHPHKEVMFAYAAGAEIETKIGLEWLDCTSPSFYADCDYRVKPKFKVGDWCKYQNSYRLIADIQYPIVKFKGVNLDFDLEVCGPMPVGYKHQKVMQLWVEGWRVEVKAVDGFWTPTSSPLWYADQEYRVTPSIRVGDWVYHFGIPRYVVSVTESTFKFKGSGDYWPFLYCTNLTSHPHMKVMQAWASGADIEVYDKGWKYTDMPSWAKLSDFRVASVSKNFQLFHNKKAYSISATFCDGKITAISAV